MKYQLNLPTTKYVTLNIITLGLYFFFLQSKINQVIKQMGLVEDYKRIYNAMSYSVGYIIIGIGMMVGSFEYLGYLGIAAIVYALHNRYVWVNCVRGAIAHHMQKTFLIEYKTNPWLAQIFPGVYLLSIINHLYDDM